MLRHAVTDGGRVKGTRLWQEARSPLISGRSKRERPFWSEFLGGWVVSLLVVDLVTYAMTVSSVPGAKVVAGVRVSGALLALLGTTARAALPAMPGALFGCWVARRMGWSRPWISGAVTGVLFGMVWLAVSAIDPGSR